MSLVILYDIQATKRTPIGIDGRLYDFDREGDGAVDRTLSHITVKRNTSFNGRLRR